MLNTTMRVGTSFKHHLFNIKKNVFDIFVLKMLIKLNN
jgi:hypothetical protein